MTIPKEAMNLIKNSEGVRLRAYRDATGTLTIGYGHTKGVKPNDAITMETAIKYLNEDVAEAEAAVKKAVKVKLNPYQLGALTSFVFNVGIEKFQKSTLLRLLNQGKYDSVPEQLLKWVYSKKKRLTGLVTRRTKEAELWSFLAPALEGEASNKACSEQPVTKPEIVTWGAILSAIPVALFDKPWVLLGVIAIIAIATYFLRKGNK